MRYFKVTDGKIRSLYYDYLYGKGVQYKVGEFVRPKVGKLFCYSLNHCNKSRVVKDPFNRPMKYIGKNHQG